MRAWMLLLAVVSFAPPAAAECPAIKSDAIEEANEGDAAARAMDIDRAIERYLRAHDLAPDSPLVLWKLASAYMKKESWGSADQTLARASVLAPKNGRYKTYRGIALSRQQKWAEAKPVLEEAVALDPNSADARDEHTVHALHLHDEQSALVHYTKAIELSPEDPLFYASLADLYLRLAFDAQAERVLKAGEQRISDETKKFAIYTLHGDTLDSRNDHLGASKQYELAKQACGSCNKQGESIAFFNLGASYASLSPPRKSEATSNLTTFVKVICRGGAAARYADQCAQAQQLMSRMGSALP